MKSYLKLCTFLCNFSRSSLPPLPPKRSLSSYFSNRSKGQLKGQFWQIWLTTSNNGAGGNYLPLEGENVALSTLLDPHLPPEPEVVSLPLMNLRGEEPFASTTLHSRNPILIKKEWGPSAHDLRIFQKWECSQKKRKRQFSSTLS